MKKDKIVCKICDREFRTLLGLATHIAETHKISTKHYYDIYLRKDREGKCLVCGNETRFGSLRIGYRKFCSRRCSIIPYAKRIKGKTYEEIYGKERAKEIKKLVGVFRKGKTNREIYGDEKAQEISKKLSFSSRKFQEENPEYTYEIRSKAGRLGFKSLKENNPEALHRIRVLAGKAVHKKHPDLARNNLPNPRLEYDGHYFWSKQEIECYKYLVNLGVNFIPHFRIGGKEIDFFIENKLFWEHHPIPGMKSYGETYEEYYQRRRELLDSNGYQDYKLIVTTSLKEMDIIEREINDQKRNRT